MNVKSNNLSVVHKNQDECSQFIIELFNSKKKANARYSIRAFAKYLDVDHSLLAKFIKGDVALSPRTTFSCLKKLGAPEDLLKESLKRAKNNEHYIEAHDDHFEGITDWHYSVILELMTLPDFKLTPESICTRLNITHNEATEYISKLENYGFIIKSNNRYILKDLYTTWYPNQETDLAKKQSQVNLLTKSISTIDHVPFKDRDHSSIILALSKSDMVKYKKILKDTRRQLTKLVQRNKDFDDVYCLQISFFPLTSPTKEL